VRQNVAVAHADPQRGDSIESQTGRPLTQSGYGHTARNGAPLRELEHSLRRDKNAPLGRGLGCLRLAAAARSPRLLLGRLRDRLGERRRGDRFGRN
jgi:hypothetical protein